MMPKLTKDRSVTIFCMRILVHLHTLFGFTQTMHTNSRKGISLEKHLTISEQNKIIRTTRRTMGERRGLQFVRTRNK